MSDRDYVLGTHDAELQRLGLQHQIWRAQAYSIWERAGFVPGMRLLDVGCGPGFGTADLAQLVGPAGHVTGVDASEKYLAFVRSRGLSNVQVLRGDVQQLHDVLPEIAFDGAYMRWVICYVPQSQSVIDGVARSLKPGGRFAIQEYYNYTAIKIAPRSAIFEKVVSAVAESFRRRGGDPDIGCRLPALLHDGGFEIESIEPITRLGKPDGSLWQWPATFFRIFVPTLVEMKLLTIDDQREFERAWAAHEADPHAFFTSPPMVSVIARKR